MKVVTAAVRWRRLANRWNELAAAPLGERTASEAVIVADANIAGALKCAIKPWPASEASRMQIAAISRRLQALIESDELGAEAYLRPWLELSREVVYS